MNESGTTERRRQSGGRRAAQRAATRQALRQAGRSCFVESGYIATRVEDIAARAEASPATFYLHFPAKRDLLLEFVTEVHDDGREYYSRLSEVIPARSPARIEEWLRTTLIRWPEMAPTVRFIEEAAATDPVIRTGYADLFALGRDTISAALVRSGIADGSAQTRALLAMSLHHGLFQEYQRGGFPDPQQTVPILSRMWWTALFE
ncbi:TetR/AcrR family transcriptional regulator [Streptomyces sp. NPDC056190]|uniref:TetR/AcrR family transcriptional regulator n=1 Tax=Streptomyces sp. NPDC056190 TaxID=3345741 RepID=UPI0035D93341